LGDLAVIEPDGSVTRLVRFGDDDQFYGASFSSDGATAVYARWASGDRNQLLTVASNGSGKPRLLLESSGSMLYEPTYSPDGTRIAYVDGGGDHSHTIRVVNADGTDVRVLIHATGPFDAVGHIRGLEWSPDGSLIAVDLRAVGDNPEGGIYTVRPDGTDLRLLIPGAGNPAWSPDGSLIAYSPYSANLNHDGVWGVWVANADGSDPQMLSPRGYAGPWNPGGLADRA
jgi:Tol biopolymer transport system component